MHLPGKDEVRDAVIAKMRDTLSQMAEAAEQTRAEATHEEAKPENDKDTRALEQSYLARGQAMRAEALLEEIQVLRFLPLTRVGPSDPIETGALVMLDSEDGERCLFLLPHGGGTEVRVGATPVLVVTPASPMGQAIVGRSVGDELELRVRGALREYEIVAVR
jgi:hypothetical protein